MSSALKEWKQYEAAKRYNNRLEPPFYDSVKTNIDFFNGNQWKNVRSNGMPTPVFNILKRGVNFFVSTLMSSSVKVLYTPMEYNEEMKDQAISEADIANAEVDNLLDKFKIDNRLREALFDAAVCGDVAAHVWFDPNARPYNGIYGDLRGEIKMELVDGTNVYFGNANNPIVNTDTQPWVILSGRDLVSNLKREAKAFMANENIETDNNFEDMAGDYGSIEIDADDSGKATYIICYKYDPDTETVKVSKLVEKSYIYKDIDTGLHHYPVAWLPWEKQKNTYHGRAICTSLIPNQIYINRMFAMIMYNLMMTAFPKAVYDADKISSWSNEIGQAIAIKNLMPGENIKSIAGYLEPGSMSNQIVQVLEMAINYTKEMFGINDNMTGNVDTSRASGKAIVATVTQSIIPLENVKANMYEFMEDLGKILLDMMGTYYGQRPVIVKVPEGQMPVMFDFATLKDTYLNCKCDVGSSSYFSEIASVETLDNLLQQGAIDIVEYLEGIPQGYISNKEELLEKVKARLRGIPGMPPMGAEAPPEIPNM